jgi:hypothetical protein
MRLAGYVARMGEMKHIHMMLENFMIIKSGRPRHRGGDEMIILEGIEKAYGVRVWSGFIWLRVGDQ